LQGRAQAAYQGFVSCVGDKQLSMIQRGQKNLAAFTKEHQDAIQKVAYYTAQGDAVMAAAYQRVADQTQYAIDVSNDYVNSARHMYDVPPQSHATVPYADDVVNASQQIQAALQQIPLNKSISITADISGVTSGVAQAQAALNSIQDKTVTITVQTVYAGGGGGVETGPLPSAPIQYPMMQLGGRIPSPGLYYMHGGEGVDRASISILNHMTNYVSRNADIDLLESRFNRNLVASVRRARAGC
jgi:hypothetical protein